MDLSPNDIKITDLESAVKLFKESRNALVTLFDNSPVCMSMTTTTLTKRTYVKVNKSFIEKFGFDESEIIGHTSVDVGILDQKESIRVGELIKENGMLRNDYVKCITKLGKIVHTVSSIELMEIDGQTYFVAFFVDITKIIDQQTTIERYATQLEVANKELESFSYSVSHDLRSPLRAIDGYTKILEEDFYALFDDEGKKLLTAIQTNANKMGTLIDDLLAFAKLGKAAVGKTKLDMNNLVNEVATELNNAAGNKAEIRIATLHPGMADYALIRQVLVNLISNGIKYSAKKPNPLIEISSRMENDSVIYAFSDNGAGFDMKYAQKLFGVFHRLHSARDFEGTGVGLAIVQRIINKHGGIVFAEGFVNKGATFSFTLPMSEL